MLQDALRAAAAVEADFPRSLAGDGAAPVVVPRSDAAWAQELADALHILDNTLQVRRGPARAAAAAAAAGIG